MVEFSITTDLITEIEALIDMLKKEEKEKERREKEKRRKGR